MQAKSLFYLFSLRGGGLELFRQPGLGARLAQGHGTCMTLTVSPSLNLVLKGPHWACPGPALVGSKDRVSWGRGGGGHSPDWPCSCPPNPDTWPRVWIPYRKPYNPPPNKPRLVWLSQHITTGIKVCRQNIQKWGAGEKMPRQVVNF